MSRGALPRFILEVMLIFFMLTNRQEALKIAKDLDQKKLEKSVAAMFGRLEKHVGMSESKVRKNYRIRSLWLFKFF